MTQAVTLRDAINECLRGHDGGPLSIRETTAWIDKHYPGRWKDISTAMADLTIGGNPSSPYRDNEKCLIRVGRGVYQQADAFMVGTMGQDTASAAVVLPEQARPTAPEPSTVSAESEDGGQAASFWIPGIPATFATSRERPWREALEQMIPAYEGGRQFAGVRLSFAVEGATRGGHPFDLDNLCDPMFSVLVNNKRHFGGVRTNIRWWSAERSVGSPTGCRIQLPDCQQPREPVGQAVFEGVYTGEFPRRATDTRIAEWIQESTDWARADDARFAIALRFGSAAVNLGDIATGTVKSVIDNLFPILGGAVQTPEDWRVERLFVSKSERDLSNDAVGIEARVL